jgi:hypothetical protein
MASPEAALITGVFGSGKSTVLAEAADLLEVGGLPFAAIDVDWLGWALTAADASTARAAGASRPDASSDRAGRDPAPAPHPASGRVAASHPAFGDVAASHHAFGAVAAPHPAFGDLALENLSLVVANDRRHGIERFLLAHAVWTPDELDALRAALSMPLRVIGLAVPLPVVQARLAGDPTRARQDDLARTEAFVRSGHEAVRVDLTLDADRPVTVIARELVDWLGWLA